MTRLGGAVPLLRCTNHAQNIVVTFDGEVKQLDLNGEDDLLERSGELMPGVLLQQFVRLDVIRISARSPDTPVGQIDLSSHYNASLIEAWHGLRDAFADKNTKWDVRGVVQLGSANRAMLYPPLAVSNIVVGLACSTLHFLEGTTKEEASGTLIGQYFVRFQNGTSESIPVLYGQHVLDWTKVPPANLRDQSLTWTVKSPTTSKTPGDRRFAYSHTWTNPQPNFVIATIDFVSSENLSAPFLLGLTAQEPQSPETTEP